MAYTRDNDSSPEFDLLLRLILRVGIFLTIVSVQAVAQDGPVRAGKAYTTGMAPVWEAIISEAGIAVEFSEAPPKRKRRAFVEGYLLLDCCHPTFYRNTPEEQATHLFSDPIYYARAHFVFPKGKVKALPEGDGLQSMRVAGIRGFDYVWQDQFGGRIDGRDHRDVMALVSSGRADVGIITALQFRIEQQKADWPLELGGVMAEGPLHASVHVSRPDLLSRINEAIAALKADGRLGRMLLLSSVAE
ncbi:MAG: transporter substrate-binding domain-containing protein [Alphaproteobacteria bacterium]|nr:transporter substrate-binding domain-containing protein [Alphaproteobacteria bacterium]